MAITISERLRTLRKSRGLTQQQLAEETQLSTSAIKSYESNAREPNSKAMAALERYFNVSGAYLRGEEDANNGRGFTFKDYGETDTVESILAATDGLIQTTNENLVVSQMKALREVDPFPVFPLYVARIFAKLSSEGQKEMLKRIEEYAIVENQKEQSKKAQKNSHPKDDYELSYVIAAKSGTWQSGIGREEILDEVKELPSESPDL